MIIDTPWSTRRKLGALEGAGVTGIIRYFNHRNSRALPEKRVTPEEARAIVEAGLMMAIVFQQRQKQITDFDAQKGRTAGARARELALGIDQPSGTAIYASVDRDFTRAADLRKITAFFRGFGSALNPAGADVSYKVGAYGSGFVLRTLRDAGLIEYLWVSMSHGFRGTQELLDAGEWHLAQQSPATELAGIGVDKNETNARFDHDFGQFTALGDARPPRGDIRIVEEPSRLRVTARRGLRLRTGPGLGFEVLETLPTGTIVFEKSRSGDWVCIDLEGDGLADGFCHGGFLEPVNPGSSG